MDKTIRDYLKAQARRGGLARAKALTPARRRAIAKQAIETRWRRRTAKD